MSHHLALAEAVRGLDAVFCCGGKVVLPEPARLRFRDGKSLTLVDRLDWRPTGVGKKLMKRCEPAPFGVGDETRRDERIRSGGQLRAERGAFQVEGLDLAKTGILSAIRQTLSPDDIPRAELYALNVYPRGGHFVAHKDTPRDSEVFGTLVVCFPVSFRGGRLVLEHGSQRSFDWETHHIWAAEPSYEVQWAAFYGDVDHAIEPVLDGTRITVTWLLRRKRGALQPHRRDDAEKRLDQALALALADESFMPRGGMLGVPCLHLYPHADSVAAEDLTERGSSRLKGRDRLVALSGLNAGLPTRYRPYLFETCANESWRLGRHPSKKEVTIFQRKRLDAFKLEGTMPIEHHAEWNEKDDVDWVVPPPWTRRDADPALDAEPAKDLLGDLEYSETGYFGNEAGDAAFYVSAALLMDVPAARKRRAARSR